MPFRAVTTVSDVSPGTSRAFLVDDREVMVCNVDGEFYAVDNVCSHDEGPLDEGAIVGCEIECPRHGARFDLRDGRATTPRRSFRSTSSLSESWETQWRSTSEMNIHAADHSGSRTSESVNGAARC